MTARERAEALEAIAAEVAVCTRCRLHEGRTRTVPGEGHASTEVVFVGEGPGFHEDQQGRPFVGAAGQFLDELLAGISWRRQEVFITNVVKCRPPGNRDPEPDEIAACAPFLRRQLEVLDPALVVTLGRHSLETFRPGARISQVHGTAAPASPETGARDAFCLAMYHPAAGLRSTAIRDTIVAEMAGLPQALQQARARRIDLRRGSAPLLPVGPSGESPEILEAESLPESPSGTVGPSLSEPGPETEQMNLFR